MFRFLILLLSLVFVTTASAVTYGDAVGQFYGQICDIQAKKCDEYPYELQAGGVWTILCTLQVANGSYTYPCYYDVWGVKGSSLWLKAFGQELKCILYGHNNGMVCMYDSQTILTGTRANTQ